CIRDFHVTGVQTCALPIFAVTQLERRFVADDDVAGRVHEGIVAIRSDAERLGSTHPEVLSALGGLYADTVSQLRPKVMVQGNPQIGRASGRDRGESGGGAG